MDKTEVLGLIYLIAIFMGFGMVVGAYLSRRLDDLHRAIEYAEMRYTN